MVALEEIDWRKQGVVVIGEIDVRKQQGVVAIERD